MKRTEVSFIYAYEESITKLTRHCLKKGERERWRGNGGDEVV
jgi:hypothetical protein